MRRPAVLAVLLLLLLACATAGPPASGPAAPASGDTLAPSELPVLGSAPARPAMVVLVSIAGLTPGRWAPGPDGRSPMPTLAALAEAGSRADALAPVAPASPMPSHASLVSGRRPAGHGIVADLLLGEHGVRSQTYDHASRLRGRTLWSALGEEQRPVAALGWPTTQGASIPFLLPDIPQVRPGRSWLAELSDSTTPWLLKLAVGSGGDAPATAVYGAARDAVLAQVACGVVTSPTPPQLVLLHLSGPRPAVLRQGPDGDAARAAYAAADAALARVLGCLGKSGRLASAALVVVGDHGYVPAHGLLSPNLLLEQEGLLSRRKSGPGLEGWRAIARSNGGSAFVYARSEGDAVRARKVLDAAARRGGRFRVVSAREMLDLGADPEAWFGLEAVPGWVFGNDLPAAFALSSAQRAAGGYLFQPEEMASGLVAWGAGIRSGVRVPWMRNVDVAPTLALLLGVRLPGAEGEPVVGLLNLPAEAGTRGESP